MLNARSSKAFELNMTVSRGAEYHKGFVNHTEMQIRKQFRYCDSPLMHTLAPDCIVREFYFNFFIVSMPPVSNVCIGEQH